MGDEQSPRVAMDDRDELVDETGPAVAADTHQSDSGKKGCGSFNAFWAGLTNGTILVKRLDDDGHGFALEVGREFRKIRFYMQIVILVMLLLVYCKLNAVLQRDAEFEEEEDLEAPPLEDQDQGSVKGQDQPEVNVEVAEAADA